jgi:hypothetical protein
MREKKLSIIEKFLKERHPELTLDPAGMGLVEPGQWILLATTADEKRYLVALDLCVRPRQCVVLPINDTIAYWHARNVLAQHPAARRHASDCAKELEDAQRGKKQS